MTRILSLALPCLPTDRLVRRNVSNDDPQVPLVTVAAIKGAQRIAAVNRAAAAQGLGPGMGLADARAVCRDLAAADADPAGEAATLRHILAWSRRFTPLVALDGSDGLLLDITGAAHLCGGETALIAAAESGLAAQGFTATAAIADTPEAAWALARFGAIRCVDGGPEAIRIVAESLPLAALRLEPASLDALAQAGLRRVGDLIIRPRAPIAARFGQGLFARLDGLLGRHRTALSPTLPVPAFMAERRFASAVARIEGVEAALDRLAVHLSEQLTRAGQGARRLEASFFRVDGVVKTLRVGTSRPTRDPGGLVRLFHEKLAVIGEDGLDTGYGFDLIRLAAHRTEPLAHAQDDIAGAGAAPAAAVDMAHLVDRLGARLGDARVLRLHDTDRHIPEHATTAISALSDAPDRPDPATAVEEPDRPLRLFDKPQPIETLATVPDGPPARFRWRRTLHEVAAIEGPERIAPPWWSATAPIRDYFQAEDGEGRRYWLYREGLYQAGAAEPRWFLHGLFG